MLKIQFTKTAPLFLAAVLMPSVSMAIEDCGTSVTECEFRQKINKAETTADDAKKRAINAQGTADDARRRADRAQGTADDAKNRAVNAQGTADDAKNRAVNAQSLAQKHERGDFQNTRLYSKVLEIKGDGSFPVYIDLADSPTDDYDMRFIMYSDNGLRLMGGNFGIGESEPQYKLDVAGTIRGHNITPSDQRLKQNIHPLENALTKLQGLRGVSFKWKDKAQGAETQIGLIAQEVEKVLPELVSTDSEGYKSIAYGQLTAVLIEAIKELQQQNEKMAKKIEALSASQP